MESNHTPETKKIMEILWLAMEVSPVFISITIAALYFLDMNRPINPEITVYLITAGLIAIPATLLFASHFRKTERTIKHDIEFENTDTQQKLQQLTAMLIIGMGIAEFPACMSLAVFMMSGDLSWAGLLIIVSLILGFTFKPDLNV